MKKNTLFTFLIFGIFFGCTFFVFNVEKVFAEDICDCEDKCLLNFLEGKDNCERPETGMNCAFKANAACVEKSFAPPAAPATPAADDKVGPPAPPPSPETVSLKNPLKSGVTDVPTLIGMIIKAALSIVGALSLFVFIQGGFTWLTSAGNPENISKGAKTMIWAVLGLAITFASYLILTSIFKLI